VAAVAVFCLAVEAGVAQAGALSGTEPVYTVAGFGTETDGDCSSGVATRARLESVGAVVALPDGDVVFLSGASLCRLAADGSVSQIADRPIAAVNVSSPHGLLANPDGSFLLTDNEGARVVRVGASGEVSTFAGTGTVGFSGDGGPATAAQLAYPNDLALLPDGSVLIAERSSGRVRKVSPAGTISTVAGNGRRPSGGSDGDGGPATAAAILPSSVAALPDGGFLIGSAPPRRVTPAGTIHTIRGFPRNAEADDILTEGGPPYLFAMEETGDDRPGLYAMRADGRVSRFLNGDGRPDVLDGDGQPATTAEFRLPLLARSADGGLMLATTQTDRERGARIQFVAPRGTPRLAAAVTTLRSRSDAATVRVRYTRTPASARLELIARGKVAASRALSPTATSVTIPLRARHAYTLRLTAVGNEGEIVTDEVPALLGTLPLTAARAAMDGFASGFGDIGVSAGVTGCRRFAATRVDCLVTTRYEHELPIVEVTQSYAVFLRADGQIYQRQYVGRRLARRPRWLARKPSLIPADDWSEWLHTWAARPVIGATGT
jgi:hypothetical protein